MPTPAATSATAAAGCSWACSSPASPWPPACCSADGSPIRAGRSSAPTWGSSVGRRRSTSQASCCARSAGRSSSRPRPDRPGRGASPRAARPPRAARCSRSGSTTWSRSARCAGCGESSSASRRSRSRSSRSASSTRSRSCRSRSRPRPTTSSSFRIPLLLVVLFGVGPCGILVAGRHLGRVPFIARRRSRLARFADQPRGTLRESRSRRGSSCSAAGARGPRGARCCSPPSESASRRGSPSSSSACRQRHH